jgi:hypothetical protein
MMPQGSAWLLLVLALVGAVTIVTLAVTCFVILGLLWNSGRLTWMSRLQNDYNAAALCAPLFVVRAVMQLITMAEAVPALLLPPPALAMGMLHGTEKGSNLTERLG